MSKARRLRSAKFAKNEREIDGSNAEAEKHRISKRRNVKVRSFLGATTRCMKDYLKPLLRKEPDKVILHIGTKSAMQNNSRRIVDSILNLKSFIENRLPTCKVLISNIFDRNDE